MTNDGSWAKMSTRRKDTAHLDALPAEAQQLVDAAIVATTS
jgi:hypothetical protein